MSSLFAVDPPEPRASTPSPSQPPSFQSAASAQGRQFAEQCDLLLESSGYRLVDRNFTLDVGVEIDRVAVAPSGHTIWFEYKGSLQGSRPGLMRTDTLKKAIANGALLNVLPDRHPFVVLTSHLPCAGAGLAMLLAARRLGYLDDVICVYDPAQAGRLRRL